MTKVSVSYNKPVENLLLHLQTFLKKGDEFQGNKNNGRFKIKSALGTFEGNYSVENNNISIYFVKKPFLVSSKILDREITKYLSNH